MGRSAIILAGGESQRFGADKGLLDLAGKPLISYVVGRTIDLVDEIVVCVKTEAQLSLYSQVLPKEVKLVVDSKDLPPCPLTGALTGLMNVKGEYSLILPCDTPFISKRIINLLFEIAVGVDAVIPRWPNGYIEPLQAVYRSKMALEAAKRMIETNNYRMQSIISLLKRVCYISTLIIKEIDPKMYTFLNINTPLDLRRAESIIRRGLVV
ncbi:MAG: molybdenum cofactor guanylyltransferase [Candidatus Bathyarchaeia archaeon]